MRYQAQIAGLAHPDTGKFTHEIVALQQNQPANHADESLVCIKQGRGHHNAGLLINYGNVGSADNGRHPADQIGEVGALRGIETGYVIRRWGSCQ